MASYRYPNLSFNITEKPFDEPAPVIKYMRSNFVGAGLDNYAQPPAQDPDMLMQLLNTMPITDGTIDKRYGYTLWANPTTTPTIQIYDYENYATAQHQIILTSPTFVQAQNDDGSNYNISLFTPTTGAGTPREVTSRGYAYLSNGTDFKKWNGAVSGGVTNWGINVTQITAAGSTLGPNLPSQSEDLGISGSSGSQVEGSQNQCSVESQLGSVGSGWFHIVLPNSPQSAIVGTELAAQDNICVTPGTSSPVGGYSDYLVVNNFGFSIPSGATITGIQVSGIGVSTQYVSDYNAFLLNGAGHSVGTNHANGGQSFPSTTTEETVTWGNSTDTWGASLTYSDINSSNFGFIYSVYDATGGFGIEIDEIYITVWYTTGSTFSWTNPTNVELNNGSYASAVATSSGTSYIQALDYGFGTPSGSVVGIQVTLKCNAGAPCTIEPVLQKAATLGTLSSFGQQKSASVPVSGSLQTVVFGGPTDTWFETWLTTDISNTGFGVAFYVIAPGASAGVNVAAVEITVYTQPGAPTLGSPGPGLITLNSGRLYCTCFSSSITGNYSSITGFSTSTGALSSNDQPLSGLTVSSDSQVDTINILATADGGDETTLYLVAALPNGTTSYTDDTPETSLLAQPVLLSTDSNGNEFGVSNNDPPPSGATMPIEHRGNIVMSNGTTLYWSKSISDVTTDTGYIAGRYEECWPPANNLQISQLAENIQGLLSDGVNLYIGTQFKIRRIQGALPNEESPDIVHNEVGILNQNVWQIVFNQGSPVGSIWLTPNNRVIMSDFNTYVDIGTPVQTVLNNINMSAAASSAVAQFYSNGPYDIYILAVPTGANTSNDTLLVYDMRAGVWYVWQLADTVVQLLFNILITGQAQLLIAASTGKLYELTPNAYQDRIDDTPVPITSAIQTSWQDFKDPTLRKALNDFEVLSSDTTMTVTIYGADKAQDFTNPISVLSAAPLVLGPRDYYHVAVAGAPSFYRWYSFAFNTTAAVKNLLEAFNIEAAPLSRI